MKIELPTDQNYLIDWKTDNGEWKPFGLTPDTYTFDQVKRILFTSGVKVMSYWPPNRDQYGYAVFVEQYAVFVEQGDEHYRIYTRGFGPSETYLSA